MADERFTVVHTNGQTQVIMPMPLDYNPIPPWVLGTDVFAIILVPLWAICSEMVRWAARFEPPSRAMFTIDSDRFRMELVSFETGELVKFECDTKKIVEIRKNRFEKGLWINVRGELMETYLEDVDDATITALADELRCAISLHAGSKSDKSAAGR